MRADEVKPPHVLKSALKRWAIALGQRRIGNIDVFHGHKSTKSCSEIWRLRFREREQVAAEAVAVVLSTDELPPFALLLAPARCHLHRLIKGVFVSI